MKEVYKVYIHGCDDTTKFNMELTKEEFELVQRLAELSEASSGYGCQPTLTVEKND